MPQSLKNAILAFLRRDVIVSLMKHHKETTSLGDRIAVARTHNQLTTAQLSRRLGVQTKTLSGWQNSTSEPRANRLTMLAGILGVSPSWLLIGHGHGPQRT